MMADDAPAYRTWKDGINNRPRIVCGICGCDKEQFDHRVCWEVAAGRGVFSGPFVVLDALRDQGAETDE